MESELMPKPIRDGYILSLELVRIQKLLQEYFLTDPGPSYQADPVYQRLNDHSRDIIQKIKKNGFGEGLT